MFTTLVYAYTTGYDYTECLSVCQLIEQVICRYLFCRLLIFLNKFSSSFLDRDVWVEGSATRAGYSTGTLD